jgi:hypothetical protein
MSLSSLEKGRLRIIAHVREELELAGLAFESILCKYGGTLTSPDTVRLFISAGGTSRHMDLKASEVEDCQSIVAGETWYKIAALIDRFKEKQSSSGGNQ